jgi:hypothetical protein
MTTRRDTNPHEDLKALAVLGARFDAAIADCERPASRRRRPLVIVAFAVAILVVAPTVASVTLGYNPLRALGFNFHSTIERDLPQAAAVIDPKNPVATGEALEELGIEVTWILIEDAPQGSGTPTKATPLDGPLAGTEILSVLGPEGEWKIGKNTRHLSIELAYPGSAILESHRE